jgi:hypothetical protein
MANDERFKPEWKDFEKRFRDQMRDTLEKLDGLPADLRSQTEEQNQGTVSSA